MAARERDRRGGTGRSAGVWGWTFTVLLLLSAGMASVPGGSDPVSRVREFYTAHAGVVIVAQVVSLLASAAFALFALSLRPRAGERRRPPGRLDVAGVAVAAASVLTVVPPVWLTVVAGSASSNTLHRLAVASDLVDVVLFVAIGAFAALLAAAGAAAWFTGVSAVVAVLAVARALELLLGSTLLELAAPLAFVALVGLVSTLVLLGRNPVPPR